MSKSLAIILIAFLCASSLSFAINASYANAAENSWKELAPMHQARRGLGVIAVDGSIYALGGSLSDYPFRNIVGTNEQYNTSTDSWVYRASMPTPRVYFAVAEYQSKIYCIGGVTGEELVDERSGYYTPMDSNVVEVYDTSTDTWATKSSMPKGGGEYVSAQEVDGLIYVFNSPYVYAYNPANDSWAEKDTRETPRYTAVVDGKIIATGSHDIGFPQDSPYYGGVNLAQQVVIYNPISNNLTQGADATIAIDAGGVGATSGTYAPPMVYVMGVKASKSPAEAVNQAYDPIANSWVSAQPMPTLRTDFGIAVLNDTLYAVGGLQLSYSYDSSGKYVQSADASATGINEQYTPLSYGTVIPTSTPTPYTSINDRNAPHLDLWDYLIPIIVIVVIVIASVLFIHAWHRKTANFRQ